MPIKTFKRKLRTAFVAHRFYLDRIFPFDREIVGSIKGYPVKARFFLNPSFRSESYYLRVGIAPEEKEELDFLSGLDVYRGKVIDVGANIGLYSVLFANLAEQVYAFEPVSLLADKVRKNAELNNLDIVVKCEAVANHEGWGRMEGVGDIRINEGSSRLLFGNEVRVITLDSYDFDGISFMKIDVEGGEMDVLKGAEKLIEKCHPAIYIENNSLSPVIRVFLLEKGYEEQNRGGNSLWI